MAHVTKTLRFWVTGICDEDFRLLHQLSRTLAACHTAFTMAAIDHVKQGKPANNECLREARRAYQEEFGRSPFVRRFGNTYTGDLAFKDFRVQWGRLRTGQKASVGFGPGGHANVTFLTCKSGGQAVLEREGMGWWMVGAQILVGEGSAARAARRWGLVPQINRGRRAKARQRQRTMMEMDGALTRNMVRLVWRKGRGWEAQVVVTLPVVVSVPQDALVCGLDVGMNHLLVASIPETRKQWWFGAQNARELWQALDGDHVRRRTLQRARKGHAARENGDKASAKRKHLCELASRQFADWCVQEGVGLVRMEELKGIREGVSKEYDQAWNRRVSNWPWFFLQQRVEQKLAAVGIAVERVQAAGTSQVCSKCGHRDALSRKGAQFRCASCGFDCHADLNAANNIARVGDGDGIDFDVPTPSRAAVRLDRPKARPQTAQLSLTAA
jgi:IS605 OrfB family transposase